MLQNFYRFLVKHFGRMYLNSAPKKSRTYISASGKVLGKEELNNLLDASLDLWLTCGRFNDEFEKKLADFLGVKYALSCNSGSSANLLALSALTSYKLAERRLKKGDEVITLATGFPTTIAPILQNGLIPVFVDINIETHNIDINKLENALTGKTKAIFIAHTLGNPFDAKTLAEFCKTHNLWLIEDNCDSLGSKLGGKYTGTFGDISTCSFYPAHHITMGEGGAVLTNNETLRKILLSFRDWGRDCICPTGKDNFCKARFTQQRGKLPLGYDHKYTYSHIGYNLKITDLQASIALAQLEKLPNFIEKRRNNFSKLLIGLKPFEKYFVLPSWLPTAEPSWFGFTLTIKDTAPFNKVEFCKYLESHNIGTRQVFAGNILRQPCFCDDEITLRINNSKNLISSNLTEQEFALLPNTELAMKSSLWLGLWHGLTEEDLTKTINTIADFIKTKETK